MRLTIVRLLMALALAGVWPASAEGAKKMNVDEKAISDLHQLFATAWSKGDTVKGATVSFGVETVRMLGTDYAIWECPIRGWRR